MDAKGKILRRKEMEDAVRKKCALNSSTILLSYTRCVDNSILLAIALEKKMAVKISNYNSNSIIDSNSACTLVIPEDKMQRESKEDSGNAQDT